MRILIAFLALAAFGAEAPKPRPPHIPDAQRAKFWRAAKELAEWQARLIQAQANAQVARQAVEQERAAMAKACGEAHQLAEDADGEPSCQPKPKAPEKPKADR